MIPKIQFHVRPYFPLHFLTRYPPHFLFHPAPFYSWRRKKWQLFFICIFFSSGKQAGHQLLPRALYRIKPGFLRWQEMVQAVVLFYPLPNNPPPRHTWARGRAGGVWKNTLKDPEKSFYALFRPKNKSMSMAPGHWWTSPPRSAHLWPQHTTQGAIRKLCGKSRAMMLQLFLINHNCFGSREIMASPVFFQRAF